MSAKTSKCSDWLEETSHKVIFVFMVLQSIALGTYTVYMFTSLDPDYDYIHFQIYKWLCLVILTLYLFYLYFHAVVKENSVELVAFLIVSTIINGNSIYRLWWYLTNKDESAFAINSQLIAIGLSVFAQLIYFLLAYFVHKKFGWKRYRLFGASAARIGMFKQYQLHQTLVKSSLILSTLICTSVFFAFYWSNMIIFCVNIFLMLAIITNHLMGIYSARYEEPTLFTSFRIIHGITELYKVAMTIVVVDTLWKDLDNDGNFACLISSIVLTVSFLVVSTPMTISILVLGHRIHNNFGEGIKEALDKDELEGENHSNYTRLN